MAKQFGTAVVWQRGVRIRNTRLWCDGPGAGEEALRFFSNSRALADAGIKSRLICTATTLQDRALWRGGRARVERSLAESIFPSWGRPFYWGAMRLELLPGGSLPGAAQLLVESDDVKTLYAGSIAAAPARANEARQVRPCDVIVVNAHQLTPEISTPSLHEARRDLIETVTAGVHKWGQVTIVADSLFTARELVHLLVPLGYDVQVHKRWRTLVSEYEPAIVQSNNEPTVRLVPAGAERSGRRQFVIGAVVQLSDDVTFIGANLDLNEQIVFPYRSDGPSTLDHIRESGAGAVILLGKVDSEFLEMVRGVGSEVTCLAPVEQMNFF